MVTKRKSAFSKALQEAQNKDQNTSNQTVIPSDSVPAQPLRSNTVQQSHSDTEKQLDGEAVKLLNHEAEKPLDSETVKPYNSKPAKPLDSNTASLPNRQTGKPENSIIATPQNSSTVNPSGGDSVELLDSKAVSPLGSQTMKGDLEKTSFYIRKNQVGKLDDLAYDYRKQTGKRINRNDIVRALIDQVDLEKLLDLMRF